MVPIGKIVLVQPMESCSVPVDLSRRRLPAAPWHLESGVVERLGDIRRSPSQVPAAAWYASRRLLDNRVCKPPRSARYALKLA